MSHKKKHFLKCVCITPRCVSNSELYSVRSVWLPSLNNIILSVDTYMTFFIHLQTQRCLESLIFYIFFNNIQAGTCVFRKYTTGVRANAHASSVYGSKKALIYWCVLVKITICQLGGMLEIVAPTAFHRWKSKYFPGFPGHFPPFSRLFKTICFKSFSGNFNR